MKQVKSRNYLSIYVNVLLSKSRRFKTTMHTITLINS